MRFWYLPKGKKEPVLLGVHYDSWPGFCGGLILYDYVLCKKEPERNDYAWDWEDSKNTQDKPWEWADLACELIKCTCGSIIFADRKGGVFDTYIFPDIPADGEEHSAGRYLYTAQVSPYYRNRSSRNLVRHCVITTKTKPRAKRVAKEAK